MSATERTGTQHPRAPETGFTLIECLVALLISAFGILSMIAIMPAAYRTAKSSSRLSVLNHLAAEKIEYLRSIDYSDTLLSSGYHPVQQTDSSGFNYYPVTSYPEAYSLRWNVSNGPTDSTGTALANMKTLDVEATYLARYTGGGSAVTSGESLTVTFRTCITN